MDIQDAIQRKKEELARRNVAVPLDDASVRVELRRLGEPITLFGETQAPRRERLRALLIAKASVGGVSPLPESATGTSNEVKKQEDEEFFYPGSPELGLWRNRIAMDSFKRAAERIARLKTEFTQCKSLPSHSVTEGSTSPLHSLFLKRTMEVTVRVERYRSVSAVLGTGRPNSLVRPFTALALCEGPATTHNPSGRLLATGSEDGVVSVWRADGAGPPIASGMNDSRLRVSDVKFIPKVHSSTIPPDGTSAGKEGFLLASSSRDHTVQLWQLSDTGDRLLPISTLKGHAGPVQRLAAHPSGSAVLSTSEDVTWRLWDIEQGACLLMQEGHSREHGRSVFGVGIHPDGSLATTTDWCGQALTWDLRSGKLIFKLPVPHSGKCLVAEWHIRSGVYLGTSGEDQNIVIWDIRNQKEALRIAGHEDTITSLRFVDLPYPSVAPGYVTGILTGSLDQTMRMWDMTHGAPLGKPLRGHTGGIRGIVTTADAESTATPSFPTIYSIAKESYWRTWKLRDIGELDDVGTAADGEVNSGGAGGQRAATKVDDDDDEVGLRRKP